MLIMLLMATSTAVCLMLLLTITMTVALLELALDVDASIDRHAALQSALGDSVWLTFVWQESLAVSTTGWQKLKERHMVIAVYIGVMLSAIQQFTGVVRPLDGLLCLHA